MHDAAGASAMLRMEERHDLSKDIAALLKKAAQQGFEVEHRRGGHTRIKCPDGALLFTGTTCRGGRGAMNLRVELRKHGLIAP